ncbi:hypothetical protein J1N35_023281 [Gossypium stocksii]|uniref:CCHC-type domain-containing protein n=1 Tax=Gossypium stocksii TaxID=47602 RepID=A0A9D3VHX5_9ROSI|nr:hypothetical protein J1N35_023281 [Gossypium stocksii]
MAVNLDQTQAPSLIPSWKDKLLGVDSSSPGKINGDSIGESEGNFELLEDGVMVDRAVLRVEYEALSTICFSCGRYGHVKEMCTFGVVDRNQESERMVKTVPEV